MPWVRADVEGDLSESRKRERGRDRKREVAENKESARELIDILDDWGLELGRRDWFQILGSRQQGLIREGTPGATRLEQTRRARNHVTESHVTMVYSD